MEPARGRHRLTPGRVHLLLVAEQLRRKVPGGIGTYLRGLVDGLISLGPEAPQLTFWASRPRSGDGDPVAELAGQVFPALTGRSGPVSPALTGRSGPAPLAVCTSRLPGPALVRSWDRGIGTPPCPADVLHAPSLTVPAGGSLPMSVMVHDLAWRRLPECFTARGRNWHEAALHRAATRAPLLLVPSRATADDLVAAGVAAARIEVVAEGSDHLPAPDHGAAAELLTRLGVPGRFLLSVSTLEPRKNLARLVAAYEAARSRLPEPLSLVVVGPAGWGRAGRSIGNRDGVIATGAVAGATLMALYERAVAVAYIPLWEGFGLPAVEAMRAGTPVVASPMPSAGEATVEVDPLDVDSIAAGLVLAATEGTARAELIEAGRRHVGALTWEATARRHLQLWERWA